MRLLNLLLLITYFALNSSSLLAQENSIDFDGTNDFVNCGTNASLNITGTDITLEAWIRPDAFKPQVWAGNIINKSGGGDTGYMLRVGNGGQVNFNLGNGGWNEINSAVGAVALNTWAHVAASYDGATMRLYVNGVQVAFSNTVINISGTTNPLYLAEDPLFNGRHYPGRIDEVKIWNVTRTPAEIISDMNDAQCTPLPGSLVAYYRFNQGTATANNAGLTNVIDETGVNNGTLTNSALNTGNSNWHNGRPAFPAADASFTLTAINCSSASASITGTGGGVFSWNPIPGDGSILNGSTGVISSGTAGSTYTIDYTVCGITTTENVTLPAGGNASFTTSVVCGGGNSTITGDLGGVFVFNPAPGDGAQINSSTGSVTSGTAGTTYNIQYTVCGTSNVETLAVLDDNCWTLNGDAQYITVGGEQCIQMTAATTNQTGCAWNGSTVDFASDFTLSLDYFFGTGGNNGADGNTFTFQPGASTACGTAGGQLGAGGLTNALSIEFDTYDNDFPAHLYDMLCDHIAVEIDGSMQFAAPLCGPVCAKAGGGNIDDGGTYTVDIEWISTTNTLNIYFDGALRLSCVNDFVTNAFAGTSEVYWGATSATGGLFNQQYFCPSSVVILPIELGTFTSTCSDENEIFEWTTITEDRVDYFQLEYTHDGLIFYPYGSIKAVGDSQEELEYSIVVSSLDKKQRYYRLKVVDIDGNFEYTDIISSRMCSNGPGLISSVNQSKESISLLTREEVKLHFVNQLGQLLFIGDSYNGLSTINTTGFATGLYLIKVENDRGEHETRRIFIAN